MDDSKKSFCNFHDSYLRQYIQQADTKASWLFAACSASLVWFSSQKQYVGNNPIETLCDINIFFLISLMFLAIACGFSFNVIRPRLLNNNKKGILYFSNVSKYQTSKDYIDAVDSNNDREIYEERLTAQYYMSKICYQKYFSLTWGSYMAIIGFVMMAIIHIYFSWMK